MEAANADNKDLVFWAPLSALTGAEIETVLVGNETFCTRCCYKTYLGDNCCPMLQSTATAKVLLESFMDNRLRRVHWDTSLEISQSRSWSRPKRTF